MNAIRDVLLERWRAALVFRFQNESAGDDAIPDGRDFPRLFPTENPDAPCLLGRVLGIAWLKFFRPMGSDCSYGIWRDGAWMISAVSRRYGHDATKNETLSTLDVVIQLALCSSPCRLEVLRKRIDAVTNAALQEWAMMAVQGIEPPDLFAGLLDDDGGSSSPMAAILPAVSVLVSPAALSAVMPATAAVLAASGGV